MNRTYPHDQQFILSVSTIDKDACHYVTFMYYNIY